MAFSYSFLQLVKFVWFFDREVYNPNFLYIRQMEFKAGLGETRTLSIVSMNEYQNQRLKLFRVASRHPKTGSKQRVCPIRWIRPNALVFTVSSVL